jgi:hypothetical protein
MSLARLGETLRAFGRIQRDRLQTSASADRDGLGRAAAHSAPQVGSDSVGCAMTENTLRAYDVDCGKPVGRTEIDGRPVLLRCCKQAGHDVGCEWQARGRVPLDLRCYPSTTHAVGGAGIVVSEAKRRCPHDTDGDGNCPVHPGGCPEADRAVAVRPVRVHQETIFSLRVEF